MKERMKKAMSYVLVTLLIMTLLPMNIFAADDSHANQIHIVVENTTYPEAAEGSGWSGTLVDKWVTIDNSSTLVTALQDALGTFDSEIVTSSYGGLYIKSINGLIEGAGAAYAGWMFSVNETMADNGISYYTVADSTLVAGDEIKFMYSLNGGADLGADYSATTSAGLEALSFSEGVLSPAFSNATKDYTLTVSDTTDLYVLAKVKNIAEKLVVKVNDTECRTSQKVSVSDGSKIEIATQQTIWAPDYSSSTIEEAKYTITVKKASTVAVSDMYSDIVNVVSDGLTEDKLVFGNEWNIMTAARAGKLSKADAKKYYESVVNKLAEVNSDLIETDRPTTNARVILALSAVGIDATDVDGHNLLAPLANLDLIKNQGINAAAYALLAINSGRYEIPAVEAGATQATVENIIDYILEKEIAAGGWDWFTTNPDVDLTAMVLQALAPYRSNTQVNTAVERGLTVLSMLQNPDGSYASWGTTNSCSIAQVIVALTELNINPNTDARFIKNGYTAVQALADYYVQGAGFAYSYGGNAQAAATQQASYALVANDRMLNGKNSLYNMHDAFEANNNDDGSNNNNNNNDNNGNSNNNGNHQAPQTLDMTNTIPVVMLLMISGMIVVLYTGKKFKNEK